MKPPAVVFGQRGDIEYSLFAESDWEGVKEVLLSSFCLHEPFSRGTGLSLPQNAAARQEVADVSLVIMRNGVSLVARDVTNGKIVGHCINTLKAYDQDGKQHYFVDFARLMRGSQPSAHALINFEVPVDVLAVHQVQCSLEIMFLGISGGYKRCGIGRTLCEYSIELGGRMRRGECWQNVSAAIREAALRPEVISAVFTSAFSLRIAEQLGFEANGRVAFADVVCDGQTLAERIGDERHSAAVLMSRRL